MHFAYLPLLGYLPYTLVIDYDMMGSILGIRTDFSRTCSAFRRVWFRPFGSHSGFRPRVCFWPPNWGPGFLSASDYTFVDGAHTQAVRRWALSLTPQGAEQHAACPACPRARRALALALNRITLIRGWFAHGTSL